MKKQFNINNTKIVIDYVNKCVESILFKDKQLIFDKAPFFTIKMRSKKALKKYISAFDFDFIGIEEQGVLYHHNDVDVYLNENGNIYVEVKNYQFDLKLVKRIVEVNGVKVNERIEDVDIANLKNGTATTATYTLNKAPIAVKNGDIVKYTLRVYNEGNMGVS